MNLLYLTIVIPLLSFLLLVCIGRHSRVENIIVIGISTIALLCLLLVFVCIDYQANTIPDTSLIYSRFLWEWFSVGDFKVPLLLHLDGLSLIFLIIISFFCLFIYLFSAFYLTSSNDIYTFFAYGNLLVASLFLLILADNFFVFLVGWEGVSLSCYLLIGIYYKQIRTGIAAVKAFIVFHIADLFILIGIFLLYGELHTLNIRDILSLASANLAVDSEIIFWVTIMLFIGVMGKSGLFPFHTWFAETPVAPMPVMTLLQSCTVVLSGIYLLLRLNPLFIMSSDIFPIIGLVAGVTIIFSSCVSLVQNDIKRLVTYLNLGQICYIFLAFVSQNWLLSLNFVISYSVMSTLLLLSSATLIKICNGERDIYKLGGLYRRYPVLYGCFLVSAASLSSMPWIMSSFYTKGDIVWSLMVNDKMATGTLALIGILLSTLSMLRMIFTVFHHKQKLQKFVKISNAVYIPLIILSVMTSAIFIYFPLPIQGIIPIADLDTRYQLSFQMLLAAVTILGILIAYILYAQTNSEINEIANTPIGKVLMRLWVNEWQFERVLQMIFVKPYLYIATLIRKDPLSKWTNVLTWGIKKVNFQITPLENGRLRWYMMTIVGGSIIVLLLLILV